MVRRSRLTNAEIGVPARVGRSRPCGGDRVPGTGGAGGGEDDRARERIAAPASSSVRLVSERCESARRTGPVADLVLASKGLGDGAPTVAGEGRPSLVHRVLSGIRRRRRDTASGAVRDRVPRPVRPPRPPSHVAARCVATLRSDVPHFWGAICAPTSDGFHRGVDAGRNMQEFQYLLA